MPVQIISPKDAMVSLLVPAGNFEMGSNDGPDQERPAHSVYLDTFYIDKTEVTNGMYAKCVADGACSQPLSSQSPLRSSYYGNTAFANFPVINVQWNQAFAYCQWAGRRLPTEAEWEKAARGTDGRQYPWGNQAPDADHLNFDQNIKDSTETGKYPSGASPYGALDMAGNVWEWVNDVYSPYSGETQRNPTGATTGDTRVMRGGAWQTTALLVRSTTRGGASMYYRVDSLGFRCAR
jgi:serine/threonine-protein kinase